jgi:hypothetical protein
LKVCNLPFELLDQRDCGLIGQYAGWSRQNASEFMFNFVSHQFLDI